MRRFATLGAMVLCAAVGLPAPPALGQSFTGFGAAPRLALPGEGPVETRPPSDREAGGREPEMRRLRRLPTLPSGLRLAGEDASLTWSIYLTEAQAAAARLDIAYLSAISVAPEGSSMSVRINGTAVGRTPIRAPGAIKIVGFDVPAGLLKPGYNAVRIDASQRHRVDCSLQATHELWTQIDPASSGFSFAPEVPIAPDALRDLAALPTDTGGATPITVVMGGRPDLAGLSRILSAVQAVVLTGRISQPVVSFGGVHPGPSGLILAVGTAASLATVQGLDGAAPGNGPRSVLKPGDAARPAMLIVSGDSEADVTAAIAALRPEPSPRGTPAGLRALALEDGFRVEGEQTVSLAQMGLTSRDFSGRLGRASAQIELPQDFLAADYGKVTLHLQGGYAGGLLPGAQVMVDVNGRNVANVRLPRAGGDFFRDVELQLPLSRWRPGANLLEIAAEVPTPTDRVCDTSLPSETRERFLLLDSTALRFPTLARVLKVPDLAATAGGGGVYALEGRKMRLVLPVPDADTVAAAAMVAARLAKSAGRVIDFEIGTTRQLAEDGPTVVVAPIRSLDPATIGSIGLSPDQVRTVWQARAEASAPGATPEFDAYSLDSLRRNVPAACAAAAPRYAIVRPREPGRPGARPTSEADRELATRWEGLRQRTGFVDQFVDAVLGIKRRVMVFGASTLGYARAKVAQAPVALPSSASLFVGQGIAGAGLDQLLTVVTAPNAALLRTGVACLVDPVIWNRLDGRLAFLDTGAGEVSTVPADMLDLVPTKGNSIDNARLVAAGWLSLNPLAYVGLTLGAALCLGWSTTNLVRQIGRRNS